jgi:predicted enzyme related to lactoylglutathione lyase
MLMEAKQVFGSFSVDDIGLAAQFYEKTLGLKAELLSDEGPLFLSGPEGSRTMVYAKPDHVPATFTVLNISVHDLAVAVDELKSLGVEFQRYPGIEADERGIHKSRGHSIAWFEDPAGNNLAVAQMS